MQWKTTTETWGSVARFLHWTIAVLVISMLIVGYWMTDLAPSADKMRIYSWHKSVGITILILTSLRLCWRMFDPRPADPPGFGPVAARVSRFVHSAFYILLIAMPLSGWLYNSASNFPLRWFGWIKIPALTAADPKLKSLANESHEILSYVILALLLVHVAGAFKHHWLDRDTVLRRMLPFSRIKPGNS